MTWRHMGIEGKTPPFLTSALDGGEWLASRTSRFTPAERVPGTHWIGGWVGSWSGLDAVEKTKICTAGNQTPAFQPVARRYTDWATPTPKEENTMGKISKTMRSVSYFWNGT
jgi:hypothetical protein